MVVVEHLHERFDLRPLGDLLLAHGGGHFTGVAVDAGHQSVAVGTVGGAVVNVLQTGERSRVRTGSEPDQNRARTTVVPSR